MENEKKCLGIRGIVKTALIFGLTVCMLLSFGVFNQSVAHAATTLSVNTGTVIQNNFLGVGAVYHGFAYMPESNAKGYN